MITEFEQKTGDTRPDPRNYQHLVSAYAHRGDFVNMEKCYRLNFDLVISGTPQHMYQSILSMVPFSEVDSYFQDMQKYNLQNLRHYNTVITRAVEHDQYPVAKKVYEQLKEHGGIAADGWTIGPLLKGLMKTGNYRDLEGYLEDIEYYQIQKEESLLSLIVAICGAYNVPLGMKYVTIIVEAAVVNHPGTVAICSRFLANAHAPELLDRLLFKCTQNPPVLTSEVGNTLMYQYIQLNEYERLGVLFDFAVDRKISLELHRIRVDKLFPVVTMATAHNFLLLLDHEQYGYRPEFLEKVALLTQQYFPELTEEIGFVRSLVK